MRAHPSPIELTSSVCARHIVSARNFNAPVVAGLRCLSLPRVERVISMPAHLSLTAERVLRLVDRRAETKVKVSRRPQVSALSGRVGHVSGSSSSCALIVGAAIFFTTPRVLD
jgi:hypothetical protein